MFYGPFYGKISLEQFLFLAGKDTYLQKKIPGLRARRLKGHFARCMLYIRNVRRESRGDETA